MNITKKQVYIFAAILIILFLIIWGFLPTPVPVTVEEVQEAPLEVTIEEEGITRVTDRFTISAPVTGYLLRLPHEVGDSVATGQVLFHIQPIPDLISARQSEVAKEQLEAAKARLQLAQENRDLAREEKRSAEMDLQRIQNLFEAGIGSEQRLDDTRLLARRAEAQLNSADFAVRVAEHELKAATFALQAFYAGDGQEQVAIEAPVAGRLLSIYHKSEGTVQAGTPIMDVGDPYSLEIKVDLLSTDAVQIGRGTEVRIKRWGSDQVLRGSVQVVEPSGFTRISALGVEEQRVPVIVDIRSPQEEWQSLGDGYRVVAEFIIWQGDEVMQVPSSSLFRTEGEQWSLFVVEDEKAQLRHVEAGKQSGLQTQITDGLTLGEHVITHPDERIEDGVWVSVRE